MKSPPLAMGGRRRHQVARPSQKQRERSQQERDDPHQLRLKNLLFTPQKKLTRKIELN
ncbi:MAG: hypothetical protein V7K91_13120 [Nostoc sp.]